MYKGHSPRVLYKIINVSKHAVSIPLQHYGD